MEMVGAQIDGPRPGVSIETLQPSAKHMVVVELAQEAVDAVGVDAALSHPDLVVVLDPRGRN